MDTVICQIENEFEFRKLNKYEESFYAIGYKKYLIFKNKRFFIKTVCCDFEYPKLDGEPEDSILADYENGKYLSFSELKAIDIHNDFLHIVEEDFTLFYLNRHSLMPSESLEYLDLEENVYDFNWKIESQIKFKVKLIEEKISGFSKNIHRFFITKKYIYDGKDNFNVEKSFSNRIEADNHFEYLRKNSLNHDESYYFLEL